MRAARTLSLLATLEGRPPRGGRLLGSFGRLFPERCCCGEGGERGFAGCAGVSSAGGEHSLLPSRAAAAWSGSVADVEASLGSASAAEPAAGDCERTRGGAGAGGGCFALFPCPGGSFFGGDACGGSGGLLRVRCGPVAGALEGTSRRPAGSASPAVGLAGAGSGRGSRSLGLSSDFAAARCGIVLGRFLGGALPPVRTDFDFAPVGGGGRCAGNLGGIYKWGALAKDLSAYAAEIHGGDNKQKRGRGQAHQCYNVIAPALKPTLRAAHPWLEATGGGGLGLPFWLCLATCGAKFSVTFRIAGSHALAASLARYELLGTA